MPLIARIRRGLRKPPRIILIRSGQELRTKLDKHTSRFRPARLNEGRLLALLEAESLQQLWSRLSKMAFPANTACVNLQNLDELCPGASESIRARASAALDRKIDLLGSGPVQLGAHVQWNVDFKTGHQWPDKYAKSIEYSNLDLPSDVKIPWEISRLQWLMPVGQAYLLFREERYAAFVRDILLEWLEGNPYARSINWSCTMEAAMRLFTFTWFFHVFSQSDAWRDPAFQFRFLQAIFLHAEYTERHIEISDIAGNHYTADAAALVFAGLFFGTGKDANRWVRVGWDTLSRELPRQVHRDGVDFEASIPYHRLVQELFLLPAVYRSLQGLPVDSSYRERLIAMAEFTAAYSKPDGACPLWGDADDARTLPYGQQDLNDHRYLVGLGAVAWKCERLAAMFSGPVDELYWMFGPEACKYVLPKAGVKHLSSTGFEAGGFFVMRSEEDHVFIDCGPVGLGGRGGHGHNDCLSFEAVLCGCRLISDCGAYVYTASAAERNRFRSTSYHNTPLVDGQEMNRFISWNTLWTLHYDARPILRKWICKPTVDEFEGAHLGYEKLPNPTLVVRNIQLDHVSHTLRIKDDFTGSGTHFMETPLHLDPGVTVALTEPGCARLRVKSKEFDVRWAPASGWEFEIEPARISPRYGVIVPSKRLVWRYAGALRRLEVVISPVI